jgi:L-rhamnose mutarotase
MENQGYGSSMQTIIRIAQLKPGMVERYEQLHRYIPKPIEAHLVGSGIQLLEIVRHDLTLVMRIILDQAGADPVLVIDKATEEEWQRVTGECFSLIWTDVVPVYRLHAGGKT